MGFDLRTIFEESNDKFIFNRYVCKYGLNNAEGHDYVGSWEYLKYWGTQKIKLYKLLNNQFIYKVPYTYKKNASEMDREVRTICSNSDFFKHIQYLFDALYKNAISTDENVVNKIAFSYHGLCDLDIFKAYEFSKGTISVPRRIKFKDDRKDFQIQSGAKTMKIAQKIVKVLKPEIEEYCSISYDQLLKEFDDFRVKISMVTNLKEIKGNLCLSIHPMDFVTMSDNASDWTSCMNWTKDKDEGIYGGCYHIGTVEMMNSNNVIVAYLESKDPYVFDTNEETGEVYMWNNKKWRQLFYVTKDIIVSGKSYPYTESSISDDILGIIRELAKKNLRWEYTFGPEYYQDMIHINSMQAMQSNKDWIAGRHTFKHNIIFESNGMYNDMFNDNSFPYRCIRNKVKRTKVITYSGKCPCLSCNRQVIEWQDPDWEEYNERYEGVNRSICRECMDNGYCWYCDRYKGKSNLIYHESLDNPICIDCFRCLPLL